MTKLTIILICIIVLLLGIISLQIHSNKPSAPILTETTKEIKTVLPVETKIIYRNVPAVIDSSLGYEIARHHAEIDSNKVKVKLDVTYDTKAKTFDVKHEIQALRDSVYVEKVITKIVKESHKKKVIGLTGGIGVGFDMPADAQTPELISASLDIGAKLVEKYSVTVFGTTDKTFGLRLGVDF